MADEQRSLMGYKSKVHEQGEFENPNEGKPPLTEFDEYVFRLVEFPHVKTFQQIKEKKDGTKVTINVDKAICNFEEEKSKNIVNAFFRIDSLNFSDEESFESAIIRFFRKIGTPLYGGIEPEWDRYFCVGMRFRGRVVIGKDQEKKPNGNYYLDVPTCRPILATDRHPESNPQPQSQTPSVSPANGADLANAKLIVHGCANRIDAIRRLSDARVSGAVITAFIAADDAGQITYPI